jgi:hypothetical protein
MKKELMDYLGKGEVYALNGGIRVERARVVELIELHSLTGESVSGFLAMCSCGEAVDSYQEHLIALIKGENKTNFEVYLEEQLKNPAVKEAFEGENE